MTIRRSRAGLASRRRVHEGDLVSGELERCGRFTDDPAGGRVGEPQASPILAVL